jgi:hypothetical protein
MKGECMMGAAKEVKKGTIRFRQFVDDTVNGRGPDATGPGPEEKKMVAEFYQLCSLPKLDRKKIEAFLIKNDYGDRGDVLNMEDWDDIDDLRDRMRDIARADPRVMY